MFVKKDPDTKKVACKKAVLVNFAKLTGKHLRGNLFSIKLHATGLQLFKEGALTQMLFYKFRRTFKNTFFNTAPLVAASGLCYLIK